jgi:hypothetical protein
MAQIYNTYYFKSKSHTVCNLHVGLEDDSGWKKLYGTDSKGQGEL